MHDEGPVRAPLPDEQPTEQRERVRPAEAGDLPLVRTPDDEVRALALPDLLAQHAPDDLRVLLVIDVEATARHLHVVCGQLRQGLVQGEFVRLLGGQHRERRTVVADVEAALADLAEGDEGEALVGDVGETVVRGDRAEQDFYGVVVVSGGTATQQCERAVVVQEPGQVHEFLFIVIVGDREERPWS
jgi:hypothetical protein